MKIGISSHVSYSIPLERCVESLLEAGFSKDEVYAFVGCDDGGDYIEREGPCGIRAYSVPHNSFDFTAMISVLDLDLEDSWMFVHDTITVEPKFADVVRAADGVDVLALTKECPSMNMGLFSWKRLQSIRDELGKFRNATKRACVNSEDVFLKGCGAMNSTWREDKGQKDVYGAGTTRIVEYYPDVGVYKYKANWVVKDVYLVTP